MLQQGPDAEALTKKCPWQVAPASNRPAVLPDGSYATQVAAVDSFTVPSLGIGLSSTNLRCASGSGHLSWHHGEVADVLFLACCSMHHTLQTGKVLPKQNTASASHALCICAETATKEHASDWQQNQRR